MYVHQPSSADNSNHLAEQMSVLQPQSVVVELQGTGGEQMCNLRVTVLGYVRATLCV